MSQANSTLKDTVLAVVESHRDRLGALMPVLHDVQAQLGCIPPDAVPLIASAMNLSRAEVQGVMGFYHDFRSQPGGRHTLQICRAEACQAVGARELEQHAQQRLGIDYHQTTADGAITLEPVYCLGNCACGPTVRVDDELRARVSPGDFDALADALQGEGQ